MISPPPVLNGYSFLRPLGSGGFTDVYLFEQAAPARKVAVKTMREDKMGAAEQQLFAREANIMAQASAHPNVMAVFEAGVSSCGRPFIAMEPGEESFEKFLGGERANLEELLSAGVQIAAALEFTNRLGFLHRDIKPANILFDAFRKPKLLDFGVACAISEMGSAPPAISWGWAAPETMAQTRSGILSEIYSFGLTLYSALAGENPLIRRLPAGLSQSNAAKKIAQIAKTWQFEPLSRPDVPPRLQQILQQALSLDPARRQTSFLEIAQQLRSAQTELGFLPTRIELGEKDSAQAFAPRRDETNPFKTSSVAPTHTRRTAPRKPAAEKKRRWPWSAR